MMIQDWFATPIYYNDMESDKIVAEKKEIIDAFDSLEKNNQLVNFNGTSRLTFSTKIESVIKHFNLINTERLVLQECHNYMTSIGVIFKNIKILHNWVIGYTNNQYQGEHNHGYDNKILSGVFYVQVSDNASPIVFSTPNPYEQHIVCTGTNLVNVSFIGYEAKENRIIIFPSFLKHNVPVNDKLQGNRLAFAFNAEVLI